MPKTISDLERLGYTLGMASGSVKAEDDALADAQAAAAPEAIAAHANTVTRETVAQLDALGKLPDTPDGRLELAQQIAAAAIEGLTTATTKEVAFHELAREIAAASPNVWRVNQVVDDVSVLQTYVAAKEDGTGWDAANQDLIDGLADAACYAERSFQVTHAEAFAAANALRATGRKVDREAGTDTFTVDGKTKTATAVVALAEQVSAEPPLPTTAEKVATVLTTAPELGDQTRAALIKALAPPHT